MEQLVPFRNSIFFGWLVLFGCAANEKPSTRFINSQLDDVRSSGGILYVNDSIFSGILFSLQPNGKDTLEIQEFRNGREHGVWKTFDKDGELQSKRFFRDGKKEGMYEAWWENGRKKLEYHFMEGEYEGNCKEWTAQGVLIKNMNYNKGHEDGRQQMWDASGKIWANYEARNGRNYGMTGVKACATLWKNDSVSVR